MRNKIFKKQKKIPGDLSTSGVKIDLQDGDSLFVKEELCILSLLCLVSDVIR